MIYATVEYYIDEYMSEIMDDEEVIEKKLKEASRIIDILTFNRIKRIGYDKLSEFEQEILQECCCEIADFYYSNSEELSTMINKYSINGVTIEYGKDSNNIVNFNGVTIPRLTYSKLSQLRFSSLTLCYNYFN